MIKIEYLIHITLVSSQLDTITVTSFLIQDILIVVVLVLTLILIILVVINIVLSVIMEVTILLRITLRVPKYAMTFGGSIWQLLLFFMAGWRKVALIIITFIYVHLLLVLRWSAILIFLGFVILDNRFLLIDYHISRALLWWIIYLVSYGRSFSLFCFLSLTLWLDIGVVQAMSVSSFVSLLMVL